MTCPVYASIKRQRSEGRFPTILVDRVEGGACWLVDGDTYEGLRLFPTYDAAAAYRSKKLEASASHAMKAANAA